MTAIGPFSIGHVTLGEITLNQEFVVGGIVAAILLGALFSSSLFRNVSFAAAAGGIIWLYTQGGVPNIMATSTIVEREFGATPDFSRGLIAGAAIALILILGLRQQRTSRP